MKKNYILKKFCRFMIERKFRLSLMLVLALGIFSCTTETKVSKWLKEHPDKFSSICADEFPVKTEYIQGKPVYYETAITIPGPTIDCPETNDNKKPKVKCPDITYMKDSVVIHDTLKIENTAKIKTYEQSLNSFKELYNKEEKIALEALEMAKKRLNIIKSLIVVLLVSLGWNFRKLIFKFL